MNETTRLFIGGLPWKMTQENLKKLIEEGDGSTTTGCGVGSVVDAVVVLERETNRSKGFGFVEIAKDRADEAIEKFDKFQIQMKDYGSPRTLTVSVAAPRDRSRSPGAGNHGGNHGDRNRSSNNRGNKGHYRERY